MRIVNGLLANFDKPLFFVESQGTGIGRVNVNFADQPRNAACNRLGPQVSIKPGCQMMPSEISRYNDAIDVNEVFVTGLKPQEIRVVVIRFREEGQKKAD
jgi:hypothetical protein